MILIATLLTLGCIAEADTTSSISANFNGTPIAGRDTVWFTSVLKASGLGSTPVTIFVRKSTITFSSNGTNYTVPAPDVNIIFSPGATTGTITFSAAKNQWQLTVPSTGLAGNVLLNAAEYLVPQGGLPGGIKNVTWQANFSTDTAGISMQWQWAAAAYSSFSTDYNAIGVKPVDDNKASQYQNSDHAGTPENFESNVTGGATGGGGSNYTGSYSGTVSLALPVVQPPTAQIAGPSSGFVAQAISFNGLASSDPSGYPLNYSWNFGDGATATGVSASHTYSSAGTFTVTLTVDDGRNVTGSTTSTANITLPPPPIIIATLSPPPNANGWNNTNVTVTFTCSDTNVGILSCPSPVTLTAEGTNQVAQGTAVNNAGVAGTASPKINIDKTPPTISASASPIANSAGWNNTNVTVTFSCSDSRSGVARCPQPILISSSGANQTVSGTATDVAGNTSLPATVTLNVELTLPNIVGSASPLPNAQGWNNTNVTVSFACTQSSSPITSCPAPHTISTEGAGQSVSGTVTDAAGNLNTGQVNLNIAKTPPAIAAAISPQPNGNGWNNSPATVSFTCTKTTAPLATCPQPQTVSAEGANQAIAGTVTDVAGNSASTTAHVFIATTPPTITALVSPQPNSNNWNNSAVTVTFNCVATTAPIADCPQPQTISTEGAGQVIAGTATDVAGNSATAKVMLNIALTPPKIVAAASPAPDPSGWNNSSVTVTFFCTNTTAPIATCPPPQTISTEGAGQTVSGTATDVAGNMASASLTLNIGTKPPTIVPSPAPPPNAAGWNNSNVTVSFACALGTAPIATCPPPVALTAEGANQTVSGTATDAAGNAAAASIVLNIDKTPPTISYSISPAPNANGINTTTPVAITFTCSDALSGVANCSAPISVTTPGMNQVFTGAASDIAGNTASATATVSIQTAPPAAPSITAAITPAPNSKGWNNSDVTVSFTCAPGSNPLASCSSPVAVGAEGANQSICGKAVDSTGLSSTACATVSLDKTPPSITATQSPAVNGSGWNNTPVTVTFACSDNLSGVATCPPPQTVSTDGVHQVINGTAVDAAGNSAAGQITLNIQQTPPSILQFSAPTQISPGQSGTAAVTAIDNLSGITAVVFQLNGATLATLTSPPYTVSFTAPTTANAGDTLTLTVSVADAAGNTNSSSRGIQVVLAGVVTGQVLSDATGLPFAGASVQIIGGSTPDTSDNTGRYSLPSNSSHLFLSISTAPNASAGIPATVTVEREMFLQSGVGTVPVDARLTSVSAPSSIGTSGGSLTAGALTIAVAPGAVASAINFHLTLLSPQGLPGLLPLGWSPTTAFDLRADTSTSASFNSTVTQLPSSLTLHLVRYDYGTHAWLMFTPNLGAVNGTLTIPIPSVGDFALVTPDVGNSAIVVPSSGQALAGVNMVALTAGSAATGSLNPLSVSPTGGTSVATLAVQSSVPLPSGTVIQANVQETYSLTSGKQLSDAKRTEDILLYQYSAPSGAAAVASFPVTPSQTFPLEQLSSGNVHLDILSGRESVRGQIGGSDAATVTGGDATLSIAAGSSPQDTAIAVTPEPVDGFLPATTSLIPLAEYNLDFSGQTLNVPAQLSVGAGSAQPGDNVLLAQIQRLNGVPYLVVVSLAQVNGATLVTRGAPGLSGLTQGGDYIFYKLTSPTGYVSGTVTASGSPVPAMVQTDGLPFVTFTGGSGSYLIPALAGTVNLSASVPKTAVAGSGTVQVTAGQTATANLVVTGQTESATITPPNGSVGVPLTPEIDITVSDAFDQTSVLSANVTLSQNAQGTNTLIPVRFVFSQGGSRLAVFPQSALQPSTTYTFAASGVANLLGGLIVVPTVTFTTQANTPPNFNTNALVFGMPDQNGNTQISAPANSFPPGTTILIVDQTNGVVLSLTVANDGSVTGQMPATIDDVLAVTITAPDKTTATFTRSQFVAPDGATAVGPGGGTVTGPGNTAIIIPQGALTKGATFKLDLLDQTAFPQLPSWPGANFGSGIQITAPAMPSFNKEAKLAFPVPANAPPGAFYYVYRRLVDPNDSTKVLFETIDHAFVQGTGSSAQVVTASPPFCGYMNSFGNFLAAANAGYQPLQTAITFTFMMWDYDPNQAGVASQGLLAGRVFQNDANGNPGPLSNGAIATITLTNNPQYMTTTTPACGTYSLFDPQRGGGTRSLTATATLPTFDPSTGNTVTQKQTIVATSAEVNGIQPDDSIFSVTAGLEAQYRNIGRFNFTFAPATPPPPPPQISIQLFTLDAGNNNLRLPVSGILQTGTQVVIAFKSNLTILGVSISGTQLSVVTPDAGDTTNGVPEPRLLNARVQELFPLINPGTYIITATGENPVTQAPVSASISILVAAQGGSNSAVISCAPTPPATAVSCAAPQVVGVSPQNGLTSVPPSVFPEVTFSEPVTQVSTANVVLTDPSGTPIPVQFLGIRPDGSVANPVQPSDIVTSITIQPTLGLKFNQTYSLSLNAKNTLGCLDSTGRPSTTSAPDGSPLIIDKNVAPNGPLCMPPFPAPVGGSSAALPYTFTTFGPQDLGGTSSQYEVLTRPVMIGQRAYAGEFVGVIMSGVGIFDISDPSMPHDLGIRASFIGRVIDATGQQNSPITGRGLIALSAGAAEDLAIPGNVWLYDVPSNCANTQAPPTCPAPNRVGAVSVSSSATQAGIATRLAMKDNYLYTFTFLQGLQVIDLQQAVSEYQQVYSTNPTQFGQAVSTEGDGFAMDSVVNTIPLPSPSGGTYMMFGLAADDFSTSGSSSATSTQTLLLATGQIPLVIADPSLGGSSAVVYPTGSLSTAPLQTTTADGKTTYQLLYGRAVALGTIPLTDSSGNAANRHVAVVAGTGRIGPATSIGTAPTVPVLAVVDVSQVYAPGQGFTPSLIGMLFLVDQNGNPVSGTDVKLSGTVALVATGSNIILVNLENPSQPALAGQITGSFGNWLGLSDAGLLVSSTSSPTTAGGSIQTTALGGTALIDAVSPLIVTTDDNSNSLQDVQVDLDLLQPPPNLQKGTVQLVRTITVDGNTTSAVIAQAPLKDLSPGKHTVTFPAGVPLNTPPESLDMQVFDSSGNPMPLFHTGILNPAEYQGLVALQNPSLTITSISPGSVAAGSGDTVFTLTGSGLNTLSTLYVSTPDGTWNPVGVSGKTQLSQNSSTLQFVLPANLLQSAGPLRISPVAELCTVNCVLLLAGDTSYPTPSAAPPAISALSPSDLIQNSDTILVIGSNFEEGATVLLGRRSGGPALALDTTFDSENSLEASLENGFLGTASDLQISVLSADGSSVSAPVPIANTVPQNFDLLDYSTLDDDFPEGSQGVASVIGSVTWNSPNTLTLVGVGLVPGMNVQFSSARGTGDPTGQNPTKPSSKPKPANSSKAVTIVDVDVPSNLTAYPLYTIRFSGKDASGKEIVTSGTGTLVPSEPFEVPFGAKAQFKVYQDKQSQDLYLLRVAYGDVTRINTRPTAKNVSGQLTSVDGATYTIDAGKNAPNPSRGPIFEQEAGADQHALYLRGLSLTPGLVPINFQLGTLSASVNARVVKRALGNSKSQWDDDIFALADLYLLPPQVLKGQAQQEGGLRDNQYRYEPMTVDFKYLTGDATVKETTKSKQVIYDVFANNRIGGPRWIYSYPFENYALQTNILSSSTPDNVQVSFTAAPFSLGSMVRGRNDLPVNNSSEAPSAMIGNTLLSFRENFSIYSLAKGSVPAVTLGPNDFSVDYLTGAITLGSPLPQGQTLTVTYQPARIEPGNPVPISGPFTGGLWGAGKDFEDYKLLWDQPGIDTIASWINRNEPNSKFFTWIAVSASNRALEYKINADQSKTVLDSRYYVPTAQFYAASSYGPLQTTLLPWNNASRKALLNQVLQVDQEPLYAVCKDRQRGLNLGAIVDGSIATTKKGGGQWNPPCANCTVQQWKAFWSGVLVNYNGAASYGPTVLKKAESYEPTLE